jgi:hypothetical protein
MAMARNLLRTNNDLRYIVSNHIRQQSHRLAEHLKQPILSLTTLSLYGFDGANSSFKLALRLYDTLINLVGKISFKN